MYWCSNVHYKFKLLVSIILGISGLAACRPDVHESAGSKQYFDLKAFINADSARLNKANMPVTKTVVHNNSNAQTKRLNIKNWGQELGQFSASDINKPAWRDGYAIKTAGDSVVYTALMPKLVTRRMVIQTVKGKVKKISINNFTQNLLYKTTEHLVYYPDSLYLIDKFQQVRLMGSNRYLITGKMKLGKCF